MATSPRAYSTLNSSQSGAADLVAPPGDQQQCQTCSAFAIATAAETAMASKLRVKAQDCSISVQALYFCPPDMPARSCSAGWDLPSVLAQLQARGQTLPTSACWPYRPDYRGELSRAATCSGTCNDPNKYASQGQFSATAVATMWEAQRYIRQYGSVVSNFDVMTDFMPFFADKRNARAIYRPSTTAEYHFGHAVVLVGYDNENQFWLVKNSWGPNWADGGFFRVAYGVCSVLSPETGEAFAVSWVPTSTPPALKLPVVPAGQNKNSCYWYKARPGDYLSKIAWLTGISLEKFMLDNVRNVRDVDVLLPGTQLLLCGPQAESILDTSSKPQPARTPSTNLVNTTLELEALLRVKASMDTTNVLQGWNRDAGTGGGYCAWRGIVCPDNEPTVEQINLWSGDGIQGLKGTLPPASAFSGLKGLTGFSVGNQPGITGTIPDWSSLRTLRDVRLINNSLSGTIPPSLGALSQLNVLYLWGNKLVGRLPDSLQQLTNLEQLAVGSNSFTWTLPSWLGKLRMLLKIDISDNKFYGTIPASLAGCTNLKEIYLCGNPDLGGCLPLSLRTKINFSPQEFRAAVLLKTRIAGYCSSYNNTTRDDPQRTHTIVSSPRPPNAPDPQLESLLKLKAVLDKANAALQGWDRDAGTNGGYCDWIGIDCLENTQEVWGINLWSGTGVQGLQGTLPSLKVFTGLSNIKFITIADQMGVSGPLPEDWSKLTQVEDIRIGNCSVTGTIPASFKAMKQLKVLALSANKLVGTLPNWLGGMTSLVELSLSRNNFTGQIPPDLSKLQNLQRLAVAANALSGTVPKSLGGMRALTEVYLWGNQQLGGCMPLAWRRQLVGVNVKRSLLQNTQIRGFC